MESLKGYNSVEERKLCAIKFKEMLEAKAKMKPNRLPLWKVLKELREI